MAEGGESVSVNPDLATLVTPLLECAICLEPFTNPLVLPCLHSFCSRCLESHVTATKGTEGNFKCPSCRQRCTVPKGGVSEFPRNIFANSLNDIVPLAVLRELESTAAAIQCKHSSQQAGLGLHGEATVFCTQCDAYLCENCAESHRVIDALKGHKLKHVDGKELENVKKAPRCHCHHDQKVTCYCKTCALPACSDCILENHKTHDTDKLSVVADSFMEDLQDVSKLAAKRLQAFGQIARDLDSNEKKMEQDLDQVSKDIAETQEKICAAVEKRGEELQDRVKKEREASRQYFKDAREEVTILQENTSKVASSAQTVCAAQSTFHTAVQAPTIKQQLLHQQRISVPSTTWNMDRQSCELSAACFLGEAEMKQPVKTQKDVENSSLGEPIRVTKLQYTGNRAASGIAPIHTNLLCVTHYENEYVWVYTDSGQLKKRVKVPGVDGICEMVLLDGNSGKIAFVDDNQNKIHLVIISVDLKVTEHTTREVPFVLRRLSVNRKKELLASPQSVKRCAVLTVGGVLLHDVHLKIPCNRISISSSAQTPSGYVVCDLLSKTVFFTDASGGLLHKSSKCEDPRSAVHTSWGHVLVSDNAGNEIVVFSEEGDFLGNVRGSDGQTKHLWRIHLDETAKVLYVGCGPAGAMEVRTYRFSPSDLPPLPVTRIVRKLEMSVKLTTI